MGRTLLDKIWDAHTVRVEDGGRCVLYIGSALKSAPCVELWHVWQGGFYLFEERPVVHRAAVRFDEFVVDDLRELGETGLWNSKETNRLSFYCLTVTR